jgi:predicted Zn-dependent protease
MESSYFKTLSERLVGSLHGPEVLTLFVEAEQSDFVRFNQAKVRQAGTVTQGLLSLDLIDGQRHAPGRYTLSGHLDEDVSRGLALLEELRQTLPYLPEDPHLLYATEVRSTQNATPSALPDAGEMVDSILDVGAGLDLVGILASGSVMRGFANSLGQFNWFASSSFNFDWSLYHRADKAVKCGYADTRWDNAELAHKMGQGAAQLEVMKRPPHRIDPGSYRAYLAPAALGEIMGMLSWGGFGLKEQRTKRSPLLRAAEGRVTLDSRFSLQENISGGIAPAFGCSGFLRPDSVELFSKGQMVDSLISPRSAKEFGVATNGAGPSESPDSLDLAPGTCAANSLLSDLGTGIWINNLWYLNYSDRSSCRITGMTRFATFWVEDGEIVAPIDVMRFDDTLYRMMGEGLVGLTEERELIMDASTYGGRSTSSARLPGALVEDFVLTL